MHVSIASRIPITADQQHSESTNHAGHIGDSLVQRMHCSLHIDSSRYRHRLSINTHTLCSRIPTRLHVSGMLRRVANTRVGTAGSGEIYAAHSSLCTAAPLLLDAMSALSSIWNSSHDPQGRRLADIAYNPNLALW